MILDCKVKIYAIYTKPLFHNFKEEMVITFNLNIADNIIRKFFCDMPLQDLL
jgi:hypothetical protein